MKICIMGTPVKSGNRGVLALGASLINLCAQAAPGTEVTLLLTNRDNLPVTFRVNGEPRPIAIVNARLSPKSRLRDHLFWILFLSLVYRFVPIKGLRNMIANRIPWIKTVRDADYVGDVRGGDSFSDIYGMQRFLIGFCTAWSVLLIKRTMVQFPQTYGPYKSRLSSILAKFLLKRSSVYARDEKSLAVARSLMPEGQKITLSPDVAFSLEVVRPEAITVEPPLDGPVKPGIVGLNVNGLMFNGGYDGKNMFGLKLDYPAFLRKLVPAILKEHTGELWLVPHTYAPAGDRESDPDASQKLYAELSPEDKARVRIVTGNYDQHEIKGVIGLCEFFVGSRMHACIGALSQGIPCVGVAYSMKFGGVFDSVGMGGWVIDARDHTEDEAVTRIVELFRERGKVSEDLGKRATQSRAKLKEVFGEMATKFAKNPAS